MNRKYKIKEEIVDRGIDGKRIHFVSVFKDSFFERWNERSFDFGDLRMFIRNKRIEEKR